MEKQKEEMEQLVDKLQNVESEMSNRLGVGKARPSKDMLALITIRERMIVARRFGEIEAIEKEIEKMRLQIQLKQ